MRERDERRKQDKTTRNDEVRGHTWAHVDTDLSLICFVSPLLSSLFSSSSEGSEARAEEGMMNNRRKRWTQTPFLFLSLPLSLAGSDDRMTD